MRKASRVEKDRSDLMDLEVLLVHRVLMAHVVKMANRAKRDHRVNVGTQDLWVAGR